MGQSVNKRQQRQALVNSEKHLGRIAAALEGIARSLHPQLADDDGPDPIEVAVRAVLYDHPDHSLCAYRGMPWSLDTETGAVWCGGHDRRQLVGAVKLDG